MIKEHDRSGWIGASDTRYVMANWNTASWDKWWLVKLGLRREHYTNIQMQTGTAYEHRILDHLRIDKRDRQIKLRRLRLRVNLDGETRSTIKEVKTCGAARFKVSRQYWMQCQVEMFAAKKQCEIIAYRLEDEDYINWFREIAPERLSVHSVEYDKCWIKSEYLPRLRILARCLREGRFPTQHERRLVNAA